MTLSCAGGLPAGAQCIFNPSAPVALGITSAAVVMTISTGTSAIALRSPVGHSIFYALWLLFPGIVIVYGEVTTRSLKRKARVAGVAMLLLLTLSLSLLSCGGVSSGGITSTTGGQPTIYQITVTGTSPGTTPDAGQSAVVALVVD